LLFSSLRPRRAPAADMQRGFAFKLMATKDIANVLAMVGVHPVVTPENIEKIGTDSRELAASMYQCLAEFAFDMEIQQVKGRAPEMAGVGQYMEIFDEAMDVVTIFKLARQLAFINRVEDFSMKDLWEPQAKRLRAVLSGMINFCRFKESQTTVITSLKQEFGAIDSTRLELVDKANIVGHDLAVAQAQHSAELQDMWVAENEMQEATSMVEKLQKQKQAADRVHDNAEAKLAGTRERLAQNERRAEQLHENIQGLQEQVAESPEGLEREVQELQMGIRQQKARVGEKSDEKRARVQRVQALGRLKSNVDEYKETLEKVVHVAALQAAACDRTRGARGELGAMRATLEVSRAEEVSLSQQVEQVSLDMNAAEQAHAGHVQEFEERRQQAMGQHQQLQEKRTDEQRMWQELQTQRAQLEAEIASVTREYEAEVNDFHAKLGGIQEEGQQYVHTVEGLVTQYDSEAGRSGFGSAVGRPIGMQSPGSARARRRSGLEGGYSCSPALRASPAPRRLMMAGSGH